MIKLQCHLKNGASYFVRHIGKETKDVMAMTNNTNFLNFRDQ